MSEDEPIMCSWCDLPADWKLKDCEDFCCDKCKIKYVEKGTELIDIRSIGND